jgi:inosine/xanthosine triphosphate pyrophosphatase family protein
MSITLDNNSQAAVMPILQKKVQGDARLRVLVLTTNKFKELEYNQSLEKMYGVNLYFKPPPEVITEAVIRKILSEMSPSPNYILREESFLENEKTKEVLAGIDIVQHPENAPDFLCSRAKLHVWKPVWNKENGSLMEIKCDQYFHKVKGYIDASRKDQYNETVFGWDHLFVNTLTGRSHLDTIHSQWGKNSARQLVLSDFVTQHLFYSHPQSLTHHQDLKPKRAVEFTMDMAVGRFMGSNKHLSNPKLSLWGLDEIITRILNEGVFFRAATSRPVKNYFSPPFGGIPLTPKKTDVEETVFMMHDLNHHNIPDLIFDGDGSEEMRNVYVVWRMMSEAVTLVIADMLYADTLVRSNPENAEKVDSRIYPLFKALDIEEPTKENREAIIRRILWANVQYAILGEDFAWKELLKPNQEDKLDAYKKHFEKFFIGDHVWTKANFTNMASMQGFYKDWIAAVGKDQFDRAGLLLLSDIVSKLKSRRAADLVSLKNLVMHVFEEIMDTRIFPKESRQVKIDEDERLSRAFHRYMIGQMSFYFRYQDLEGFPNRIQAMALKLKNEKFDEAERTAIYRQYMDDVRYVWGVGLITSASADNYVQIHPIFPPVYINYSRQDSKSIVEVLDRLYGAPSWSEKQPIYVNTSNKGKLAEYEEYFKTQQLITRSEDLVEPNADPLTVIQYKASQFDRVLVDDVALDVEGMNIGVNIRSVIKKIDLAGLAGKNCTYVCRIAIKVDQFVRVYEGAVKGTLVESKGECFGFGRYFLPDGAGKTLGEYMDPQYNARYLAIQKLKKEERSATLPLLTEWKGPFQE